MSGPARPEPVIRFTRDFWFPLSPSRMWETIDDFDRYPTWWRWLRDFSPRPEGSGLTEGTELTGTVVPPVPYRLSLRVTLDRCLPPVRIEASIDGDLVGNAVLQLAQDGDGTSATVAWTLRFASRPLRLAARIAFPVMQWGHDQVVVAAAAGFRRHALETVDS